MRTPKKPASSLSHVQEAIVAKLGYIIDNIEMVPLEKHAKVLLTCARAHQILRLTEAGARPLPFRR